jgi:hypothetical protein
VNFRPELAEKVMAGEKTVTRRLVSDNPRSPWWVEGCGVKVGKSYAVCSGRGRHAIGRVVVTDVRQEFLGAVNDPEARREGFDTRHSFVRAWRAINGDFRELARVWRIEFKRELPHEREDE